MRMVWDQFIERLERFFRSIFLHEPNRYHNGHRNCNADGVVQISHEPRYDGRGEQEENKSFLELLEKPKPQRLRLLMLELIGAIIEQSGLGVRGREAMG